MITVGSIVKFSPAVVARCGTTNYTSTGKMVKLARGIVVSVSTRVADVDFHGTWMDGENGSIRCVPIANLCEVES